MQKEHEVLWEGRFIRTVRQGQWEYVQRHNNNGVVGIVPITDTDEIVLIEQWRIPLGKHVIELPAGLSGDETDTSDEALIDAAKRELLEETGYEATDWKSVGNGASSAGLTDEVISLYIARDLRKVGNGGGDGTEDIRVHVIKLHHAQQWLMNQESEGKAIDVKVYAGLYFVATT
ncbi:NUDIX hydrolase [Poriferisphaera sp. WC338]|uniref:NUDIX hydrolase n=1 Tax=Poriferisphaera sp. WC338 TaxID=3425129 RepID=UPI003D818DE5